MKTYRTVLNVVRSNTEIGHQNKLLSMGSCFSENIGERLVNYKFPIIVNPYGILFHPIAIAQSLQQIIDNQLFSESDIFYFNQRWQSFYHHGRFANVDKLACLKGINQAIQMTHQWLQNLDFLILTFGTANVFVHQKTGKIVANCHKIPNTEFERKRLTIEEITTAFEPIFKKLKQINPRLKIILTVSPVRHIRDGLVDNQRSKATLLLVIEELVKNHDFVSYFPAYELVLDDLRDYRFFKDDMIHPSNLAIDYVWAFFSKTYFSEKTLQLNRQIDTIIQAKNHRPFDEHSAAHQQFIQNQIHKIQLLKQQHNDLNVEDDLKWFTDLLK